MNYFKILSTLVFVILCSKLLSFIKNKSNFPKKYIIPILVAGLTKYCIGDWDKGYTWSLMDILYWMIIIVTSYNISK